MRSFVRGQEEYSNSGLVESESCFAFPLSPHVFFFVATTTNNKAFFFASSRRTVPALSLLSLPPRTIQLLELIHSYHTRSNGG
jgi:hypothetical protein